MSEGFQIAPHKDVHVNHVKFVAKARVGEVCSDRKKLLDEVKKRVALTEDEAEILAYDDSLWNKDAHGDLVKLAAKARVGEVLFTQIKDSFTRLINELL